MLALVLGTLLLAGPPASAHGGGGAAATIEAGPYLVYAYDGEPGAEPDTTRYTMMGAVAEVPSLVVDGLPHPKTTPAKATTRSPRSRGARSHCFG